MTTLLAVVVLSLSACGAGGVPLSARQTETAAPGEGIPIDGPPAGNEPAPPVDAPTEPLEERPVADAPVGGPMLPDGSRWVYVWGDEFDGDTLNRDRWGYPPRSWRRPSRVHAGKTIDTKWIPENASVSDGHLVLLNTRQIPSPEGGDALLHTTAVWSRPEPGSSRDTRTEVGFETVYGYFEARVQIPPTKAGVHGAFWLQSYHVIDGQRGNEIDILESPRVDDWFHVAVHKRGPGIDGRISWGKQIPLPGLHEGFHVFAVHWQPDRYDFYANGEFVASYAEAPLSHVPQFIYLSTQPHWKREGHGSAYTGTFPNEARVDWVRVWKMVDDVTPAVDP